MDHDQELLAQIGAKLKADRLRARVTQKEAAAEAGVDRTTISNWEAGRGQPNLLQFRALCVLYGVTGYDTMFNENPFELTRAEALELSRAARSFTQSLCSKISMLLTLHSKPDREETAR
jgi:transcriptional regulator with XRE-family HTH domain